MVDPEAIRKILADESLTALVENLKAQKAKIILGRNTSDEAREDALSEYHALGQIITAMHKASKAN